MNQFSPVIPNKRVPHQYHLSVFTNTHYQGLPVVNCNGGLVTEYLDRLYITIQNACVKSSRVFAVRIDLQFPGYYSGPDGEILSNQYLHDFIINLRSALLQYSNNKKLQGIRVHTTDFDYVWAREYGINSNNPHFHLLLLFNGHTFNSLGSFSSDHDSLYNRIGGAWGRVLGLHEVEGARYIHFPHNGCYMVQSDCNSGVSEVFHRTSYLAKVVSKKFGGGCHVFGGSRV